MLTLLFALLLPAASADDALAPPAPGTLTHEVWRVLSQRHDAGCQSVLALGTAEEVRDSLLTIAEGAEAPPWAPLRAASCLTAEMGSDPLVQPALERWVREPAYSGLGFAVLQGVDALPEGQAVALAKVALARTDERFLGKARRALGASTRPVVQDTLKTTPAAQ